MEEASIFSALMAHVAETAFELPGAMQQKAESTNPAPLTSEKPWEHAAIFPLLASAQRRGAPSADTVDPAHVKRLPFFLV